jgi:hypothetical protein
MKLALIVPGDLELQPYVFYYTSVLDRNSINYEYIQWCRDMTNKDFFNNKKVVSLGNKSSIKKNNILKIIDYYTFSREVINYIKKNKFDFLVVFTIPNALFLKRFLMRQYRSRFIFDIRDYSLMNIFFKKSIEAVITNSLFTTVSSTGFLKWLPKNYSYTLSHNIAKSSLIFSCDDDIILNCDPLKLLTIGRIRDYEVNKNIIKILAEKTNMQLIIVGVGHVKDKLERYFFSKFNNVIFGGFYNKNEELQIVKAANMINLIMPNNTLSCTLMSNRFYSGINYRRPLIVNENSHHANYVHKYNLGIVLKSYKNMYTDIIKYTKSFDQKIFKKGCDDLIAEINNDILVFESKLISSFNHTN